MLIEEQQEYYLTYSWKGVIREFLLSKMNLIASQEFELTYYNVTIQYISQYTMGTPALKCS